MQLFAFMTFTNTVDLYQHHCVYCMSLLWLQFFSQKIWGSLPVIDTWCWSQHSLLCKGQKTGSFSDHVSKFSCMNHPQQTNVMLDLKNPQLVMDCQLDMEIGPWN